MKTQILISLPLMMVSSVLFAGSYEPVRISWGIRPAMDSTVACNDTRLYDGAAEMDVDFFNDHYTLRLAYVGDGSFNETVGYADMRWLSETGAVKRSVVHPDSWLMRGECIISRSQSFDMETLGVFDPNNPAGMDADDFFWNLWMEGAFATVVYEKASGKTYRISAVEGGTDMAGESVLEGDFDIRHNLLYPDLNQFYLYVTNAQQRVYLGAPLPARCVWMADLGLTTNDLAGVSERRLALATALGKAPDEVADVTLRIDGFDPATGTVSYGFDAEAPDGTKSAVTKLWYGAELRLLSGTELGRWTTTNVVDVTGRTVAAPTGGDARFYRLELAVP